MPFMEQRTNLSTHLIKTNLQYLFSFKFYLSFSVSFIVSTLALIYNEGKEEEISFHLGVAAGVSGIIACLLIITTFCLNIRPSVESCKVEPFDNSWIVVE